VKVYLIATSCQNWAIFRLTLAVMETLYFENIFIINVIFQPRMLKDVHDVSCEDVLLFFIVGYDNKLKSCGLMKTPL